MPIPSMPMSYYDINPAYTTGAGTAYGKVPGAVGVPPPEYQQVSAAYPNLVPQAGTLSGNIGAELMGELSPQTIAALQQNAAQFGVRSGMPLSQFAGHQGLRSLGLNVEAIQRQGLQDYLAATKGIGSMMTPQALALQIAERNALFGAAPDPQKAAEQQMKDWQTKFNATAGLSFGGRGGGGLPAPTPLPSPGGGTMPTIARSFATDTLTGGVPTRSTAFNREDWLKSIGMGATPHETDWSPELYDTLNLMGSGTPQNFFDPGTMGFGDMYGDFSGGASTIDPELAFPGELYSDWENFQTPSGGINYDEYDLGELASDWGG